MLDPIWWTRARSWFLRDQEDRTYFMKQIKSEEEKFKQSP